MSATSMGSRAGRGVMQGVFAAMEQRAEKLMGIALLGLLSRGMVLIGTPVLLAMLYWAGGSLISLRERDVAQAAEQARMSAQLQTMTAKVEALESYRLEASNRGTQVRTELAAIRDAIAEQRRSTERLIDRLAPAQSERGFR